MGLSHFEYLHIKIVFFHEPHFPTTKTIRTEAWIPYGLDFYRIPEVVSVRFYGASMSRHIHDDFWVLL
jgi:hypothetical protein